MRHYILVRWRNAGTVRRTLVNLHKIVTVVDSPQYCKIHFQGYCLDVEDSFDDVIYMIERAEAEGSRKPADRPLMGTGDWMDLPGASAPVQCRAQWEADRNGWPYCTNCGVPAAIDREEFRMKGNIRAAKSPRCPTCGALMEGVQSNV